MGASFIGISKENKYVEVTERIHSIPVINTDAKDIITNAQRDEMANNQNVDFMVGSFVTWCNLTIEITSVISSLYISDDEQSIDDCNNDNVVNVGCGQNMQAEIDQLKVDLLRKSSNYRHRLQTIHKQHT